MASATDDTLQPAPAGTIARIPTGAKIFLILSIVLLLPAVISVLATLQTHRSADQDARARLTVSLRESAHALGIELVGDTTALRVTLNALDRDPSNAASCARAQGVFAPQVATGSLFMIADRRGELVCGTPFPRSLRLAAPRNSSAIAIRLVPGSGLLLAMVGNSRSTSATVFFPTAFLARIAMPQEPIGPHGSSIVHGSEQLTLAKLTGGTRLAAPQRLRAPIAIDGLTLQMSVPSTPISSPLLIAMLLPILMWIAAASIAWFVVDRLLIRPLRRLQASVAAYVPGKEIDPGVTHSLPAQEIRRLGDTFRIISRTVALHEAGLAEGLVRQTRLTREVHHRVKNNLQVISSLINFHARGARTPEATTAYASIQRRVDALAVVHRYHFAELEENRGLAMRSVIGELASNIRATAPEDSSHLGITIDIEPFLVNQDVAVAVAFLITEIVELAMTCNPAAQIRITLKPGEDDAHAVLRVGSSALVDCDALREGVAERYGRVMEGLARQLRAKLHHEPMLGTYEITIAVVGRD